ncbi:MAG: hypothetical protein K1X92_10210 [Bacteroidia bacterium]|nr:hypothetical protein [Bacteroidia bacterium]
MFDKSKNFAYIGVIMGSVFIFAGLGALMYPDNAYLSGLTPSLKKVFSFIMLIYGAFRVYRSLIIILRKEG